ncbi:hypothetical protein WOLCODRAFT_134918 [Wolfiporia cocos MD-104 SS10]|uniref:Uncharacterized protein n=1 Tax=Wolfiporia cocos (strain MD-104) TaxID=742152 RepID=A0A2H3ISZ4_WOLCO|nr:hypothetical protein WOLCODRAFT_134918 [Wolfiporia cocos MD-104 SS10]
MRARQANSDSYRFRGVYPAVYQPSLPVLRPALQSRTAVSGAAAHRRGFASASFVRIDAADRFLAPKPPGAPLSAYPAQPAACFHRVRSEARPTHDRG